MLALTFADPADYDRIREDDRIEVTGLKTFAPGSRMTVTLRHSDGTSESFGSQSYLQRTANQVGSRREPH